MGRLTGNKRKKIAATLLNRTMRSVFQNGIMTCYFVMTHAGLESQGGYWLYLDIIRLL